MSRAFILPYKMASVSGKAIAEGLGLLRIKREGRYRNRKGDTIINWGTATAPSHIPDTATYINHPSNVNIAGNKLLALRAMQNTRTPEYTEDDSVAEGWLADGEKVVIRGVLRGNSGAGITLVDNLEDSIAAPLYTKYVKKRKEYRVHVFDGEIIDYSCKMLREGSEGNNFQIRNYENGWIFGRDGVELPEDVITQSLQAVEDLGLDFGAVDVGFRNEEATVYEVNTSPGLQGATLESYLTAFRDVIN